MVLQKRWTLASATLHASDRSVIDINITCSGCLITKSAQLEKTLTLMQNARNVYFFGVGDSLLTAQDGTSVERVFIRAAQQHRIHAKAEFPLKWPRSRTFL